MAEKGKEYDALVRSRDHDLTISCRSKRDDISRRIMSVAAAPVASFDTPTNIFSDKPFARWKTRHNSVCHDDEIVAFRSSPFKWLARRSLGNV